MTTHNNAHQPDAMSAEISRQLLGLIVDEVFDGGIEDSTVIEDIYRVIARECQTNAAKRLAELEHVCAGLSQELIDGGWTAQGIRRHCKRVETEREELLVVIRDALRLLETIMASLRGTLSLQALDAIEAFLHLHAMTIVRIHLTAPANSRPEAN